MTQEYTTFIGWIENYYVELHNSRPSLAMGYALDDPDNPEQLLDIPEQTKFEDGNYTFNDPKVFAAIELMGQDMLDIANEQGVDLSQFEDLKIAFGYDLNPDEISAGEIGAYVAGVFMSDSTHKNHPGPLEPGIQNNPRGITSIFESFEIIPKEEYFTQDQFIPFVELSQELGRQVYGDNSPKTSSTDTSTDASMEKIKDFLPNIR